MRHCCAVANGIAVGNQEMGVGLIDGISMKKELLKYLMPSTLSMCYSSVER